MPLRWICSSWVLSISILAARGKLDCTMCDISVLTVAASCWLGIGALPQGGVESGKEQSSYWNSTNLGDICEVDGRSWRTTMYLQWSKDEKPLLMSVQLYYWIQRNNQAYGRNALAFPWPVRCEGPEQKVSIVNTVSWDVKLISPSLPQVWKMDVGSHRVYSPKINDLVKANYHTLSL